MTDKSLTDIANAIFVNPSNWINITDEDKSAYFFIFNRYFAKKYPLQAQMLNDKLIDYTMGMDIIYSFLRNKPYPKWFWAKNDKKSEKNSFSEKELLNLQQYLNITKDELDILIMYYPDDVNDELKYLKSLKEQEK